MTGRLGMTGVAVGRGDSEVWKAFPKRLPFLHPKARISNPVLNGARMQGNARYAKQTVRAQQHGPSAIKYAQMSHGALGPKASQKTKAALSGGDLHETLGRLGRATRRQNKEFSAIVHPHSGRVMSMRRGSEVNTGYDVGAENLKRKSYNRLADMATSATSGHVRERALAAINDTNPHLKGPAPVMVHNHPTQAGHGAHSQRTHPSTPDLQAASAFNRSQHVVLTHAPGARGTKQTRAIFSRVNPDKGIGGKEGTRINTQDAATIPRRMVPIAALRSGASRGDIKSVKGQATVYARKTKKTGKLVPYDKYIKHISRTPKAYKKSGLHTREVMLKADITMSDAEAHRLAAQHGTVGPLPKTLQRPERMKAYEARYIASGGRKAEKWKHQATGAEIGRNVALATGTGAAGVLMAARGKRTSAAMHKIPGVRRITPHHAEGAALTGATAGGVAELYGEYARHRRGKYQNSPAGVAGSALTRMQAYTAKPGA